MYKYFKYLFIFFLSNLNSIKSSVSYRTPIVIGNWKMNTNLDTAIVLTNFLLNNKKINYDDIEIGILPPIPFFGNVKYILKNSNIKVGAQNVSYPSQFLFKLVKNPSFLVSNIIVISAYLIDILLSN